MNSREQAALVEQNAQLRAMLDRIARDQTSRTALLMAVCERMHAMLDEGVVLRAETVVDGKSVLAMLYDAMEGPLED